MFQFLSKIRGLPSSFSKKNTTHDSLPTTMRANEETSTEYLDIESTDPNLHQATNQPTGSQAEGAEDQSLSSGAFAKITNNLLEVNQQIAKLIMLSDEDVRKDKDFSSLVNFFLESCYTILDLSNAMDSCFRQAKECMLITLYAVKQFERDQAEMELHDCMEEKNKCIRVVEDLKEFMEAGGDPFNEEFLRLYILVNELEVRNKHMRMWEELDKLTERTRTTFDQEFSTLLASVRQQQQTLREKLDKEATQIRKKLRRINRWKKMSDAVFAVGFFAVPVLTAVMLVVSVPSAMEVLVGAFSATLGSVGKWCSHSWNQREKAAMEQMDKITSINRSIYVNMKDMDTTDKMVGILNADIECMMAVAVLTLRKVEEEEMVKAGIDRIKKMLDSSLRIVEDAAQHASLIGKSISLGREIVSRKLTRDASKRQSWLEIFM